MPGASGARLTCWSSLVAWEALGTMASPTPCISASVSLSPTLLGGNYAPTTLMLIFNCSFWDGVCFPLPSIRFRITVVFYLVLKMSGFLSKVSWLFLCLTFSFLLSLDSQEGDSARSVSCSLCAHGTPAATLCLHRRGLTLHSHRGWVVSSPCGWWALTISFF